jgi:hypothetical protein
MCLNSHPHSWAYGKGWQGVARGGLPKVSPGPAMPYHSMPCWRATPETASWPFLEWPAAVSYPFGHPTPYVYAVHYIKEMLVNRLPFYPGWDKPTGPLDHVQ